MKEESSTEKLGKSSHDIFGDRAEQLRGSRIQPCIVKGTRAVGKQC